MQIKTEVDTSQLEQKAREVKGLADNFPTICKNLMNAINKDLRKGLQRESRARNYSRSHNFYRGIFAKAGFKKGQLKSVKSLYDNAGVGKPKGVRGKYNYYANYIEFGFRTRAKMDGKNLELKKTFVPARPFIRATVQSWYGTKGDAIMERELEKMLAKYNLK